MKTIGLIGGIGCASTEIYYELITHYLRHELGPGRTGRIILYSINEYDIYSSVKKKQWNNVGQILVRASQVLEKAEVDFILICSNLFHKFAPIVQKKCKVPLIHILVPICDEINASKYKKIGLLGTRLTLTDGFYSSYLLKHSTAEEVLIPDEKGVDKINEIIFKELLLGKVTKRSKTRLVQMIRSLQKRGAECLILGCTELSLILSQKDLALPVLDSTHLHAVYAAEQVIKALKVKALKRKKS
ncbi:MAG TPA: amino acid racemase [Chlamydiales bacterium]|jgi:aspartate racemase